MDKITIKIVKQSRADKDGYFDIALRIIKNRHKKEIRLNLKCKENEFKNQEFTKYYPDHEINNELLLKIRARALKIVREFQLTDYNFSLKEFEFKFKGIDKTGSEKNSRVIEFFDKIIEEKKETGKIGTVRSHKGSRNALIKFAGTEFTFNDIDVTFLEKFEKYLRENGNTTGGVAFKMREVRSIYNKAIMMGIASQESYPFKFYKISKLKSEKNKRALTSEEMKKIIDLDLTENPQLIDARNYFVFSFYTRGMNFVDIMKLTRNHINNGRIRYTRSKTKVPFDLEILEPVQLIIDYYQLNDNKTDYIFPILNKRNMTPVQIENRKRKVIRKINGDLKEIARLAGINKRLTTYVARHSFATILKNKGSSIEKISELMGHSDVQVTMTYLKEFESEVLDDENRKLLEL
ncbi:MAG: phage integrase SAM-like domain-containing protein [Fermentimonas sp.]